MEYAFPAEILRADGSLPELWKPLPFCALPDGIHNFATGVSYFRMPDPHSAKAIRMLACVSSVQQVDAATLLRNDATVTRNTVLKAVCVVSRVVSRGHSWLQSLRSTLFFLLVFLDPQAKKKKNDNALVADFWGGVAAHQEERSTKGMESAMAFGVVPGGWRQ